jgi:Ca-activated chloride channel family protein
MVPFTENPAAISRALDVVKPWGKTAFFDALAEMPARSELGRNPSRAIILLSDGIDNASRVTRAEIEQQLEGVSIPIYAFALREAAEAPRPAAPKTGQAAPAAPKQPAPVSEETFNIDLLGELAAASGGRLFVGNQPQQIASAMDGIEKILRAQYLLGFAPTGKGTVKYRRISLKLAGRARSVRVRAGYRGTEPPVVSAATRTKPKRNERKRS